MTTTRVAVLGCLSLALQLGCSNGTDTRSAIDQTGTDSTSDTGTEDSSTTSESDTTNDDTPCDNNGFEVLSARSVFEYETSDQFVSLEGLNAANPPFDILSLEFFGDVGGPTGPGSFELDGSNYASCGLCVMIYKGFVDGTIEKYLFANSGGVEIFGWDSVAGNLDATLTNATFQEVTVEPNTFVSTPVAGGETWCIDQVTMNGTPATSSEDSTENSTGADDSDDATTDNSNDSSGTNVSTDDTCTVEGFPDATQSFGQNGLTYVFDARRPVDADTNAVLSIEFYDGLPSAGFSFEFTGESFADCTTCAYITIGGTTDRAYLATSGTLTVDSVSETTMVGTLSNLTLGQVTTPFGSDATFVDSGEVYCIDELTIDVQ